MSRPEADLPVRGLSPPLATGDRMRPMIAVVRCPGCGGRDLHEVGRSEYRRADDPYTDDPGRAWANRAQRDFVFSEWLPGESAVTLRELLCGDCGLLVGSPRPSAADVDRKYAFLVERGITLGNAGEQPRGESRRAMLLRRRLGAHLPEEGARVLDVGGGDGHLLAGLARQGARCFLVDYADAPVAGVTKLGDTVSDLGEGERFDAVVISHVLEHVADPAALLARLRELAPVVYVEVPVEIWRTTPVGVDPVTHTNHFTEASLRSVLQRCGWQVLRSRGGFGTYAGSPLEIAWAVAAATGARGADGTRPDLDALRRLDPPLGDRVRRRLHWMAYRTAIRLLR